ncbi:MAG: Gfo/Idh/MocA family protein [Bacillota bacterium]
MEREKALSWANRLQLDKNNVYTDFKDMLERDDLDVIDIMVPIELNYEVTEAVAQILAGQHKGLICEKPLASNLIQARAARDLAQKYNIPIMIAENYRYNQEIDMIRDMVRTRRIGEVFYFIQNRVIDFPGDMLKNTLPAKEWRQHPEFPGGVFTDTGVHDLAALRHIFGAIDRLHAFGRSQEADFSPYIVINVNLLFKSGITGQFTFFCAGKEMQRPLIGLRIIGTQGMIYLEDRTAATINLAFNDGRTEQVSYEVQKGYYNELLNFHKALTGVEPISVTPEMEYGDLKTVMDVLTSIREERIVVVDEEADYHPFNQPPGHEQPRVYQ